MVSFRSATIIGVVFPSWYLLRQFYINTSIIHHIVTLYHRINVHVYSEDDGS